MCMMTRETPSPFVDGKEVSAISLIARACLKKFERLHDILHSLPLDQPGETEFDLQNTRLVVEDAHARFKAWGTNIAAFCDGNLRVSLDFRLNEAPGVKSRAIQILQDLDEYLDDVTSILVGDKSNKPWGLDDLSDSSDDSEEDTNREKEKRIDETDEFRGYTSELEELLKAISASNSSLMKLSIVIRSSATRDDYIKASLRFQKTWNTWPDVSHVIEKYGRVKNSERWLLERLGKAISRRRQFLKYRVEHHNKMTGVDDGEEERMKPEKTIFASTKATTFIGHENIIQNIKAAGSDAGNSFGTQTSYDVTVFGNDGEPAMLRVPPPPKFAFPNVKFEYGEVFQCPYCFTEQTVINKSAWKKHVFRDLKPYVCTFDGCEMLMFRSRNEWFAHELQCHRREWVCQFCDHNPFLSVPEFSKHIKSAHTASLSSAPLQALILQGEEQVDKIASDACPLCDDWKTDLHKRALSNRSTSFNPVKSVNGEIYGKPTLFRKHLGGHMEQLALFALPPNQDDEEPEDGSSDRNPQLFDHDHQLSDGKDDTEQDSLSETAGVFHSDILGDNNSELHPSNTSELDQQERQKLQTVTSYWSVSEQTEFPKLLSQFGTDWHRIAEHMNTKTHTMVKNYYIRHVESDRTIEWREIAQAADAKKRREPPYHMSQEPSTFQRENADGGPEVNPHNEESNSAISIKADDEEANVSHGGPRRASLSAHDNELKNPLAQLKGYDGSNIDDELAVNYRQTTNKGNRYRRSSIGDDFRGTHPSQVPGPAAIVDYSSRFDDEVLDDRYIELGNRRSRSIRRKIRYKTAPDDQIYSEFERNVTLDKLDTSSQPGPAYLSVSDRVLEETRRELEDYRFREESEREIEGYKKEVELKRLQEEKKEKEQEAREDAARKKAQFEEETFKAKEVERLKKEKEQEEREKVYKHRMEDDLRKSGLDEQHIAIIMKKEETKEQAPKYARPTYTRMSRRHLSLETLKVHRIEYDYDVDPDYIIIKRWVPEHEQDFLWGHTRDIREARKNRATASRNETGGRNDPDPDSKVVRKKEKRERPPSSPLLEYLAGGSGR